MKKLLCLLMIMAMLCGCGANDISNESMESSESMSASESNTNNTEVYDCENTMTSYESYEEFRQSTFYSKMIQDGFTPYNIAYDTEKYTMLGIEADVNAKFYSLAFKDNIENKVMTYSIIYDTYKEIVDEFSYGNPEETDILTTAECNGQVYDVYLSKVEYANCESYILEYLPFENYEASIVAWDEMTSDEILEYFDDFELVEAQEE